jgi:hypothetical protein
MRPSVVVDVVRVCKTKNGPAVMLDEAHPVALPSGGSSSPWSGHTA